MSTAPKFPPITIEQYMGFEAPEGYRDELIKGEVVLSLDGKPLHHDVVENIVFALKKAVAPGFKVGTRINFRMPEAHSMPSPDIWVIDQQEWREARENETYPKGSPILAVEVISASNRKRRVTQKSHLYLESGSSAVWCVYPNKHELAVHSPSGVSTYHDAPEVKVLLTKPLSGAVLLSDIFRLE